MQKRVLSNLTKSMISKNLRFSWAVYCIRGLRNWVAKYFFTLSCAELEWNEISSIISKLNGVQMSKEDTRNLPNHGRCKLPNKIPVLI